MIHYSQIFYRDGEELLCMKSLANRRKEHIRELKEFIKKYKQDVRSFFKKVTYIERDDD